MWFAKFLRLHVLLVLVLVLGVVAPGQGRATCQNVRTIIPAPLAGAERLFEVFEGQVRNSWTSAQWLW